MSLTPGIEEYNVTLRNATLKEHFVIIQRPRILNFRLLDAHHPRAPSVQLPVFVESLQDVGPIFFAKDNFNCASVDRIHIHDMNEFLSKHLRH